MCVLPMGISQIQKRFNGKLRWGRSPDLLHNDHDFSNRHMSNKFDKDLIR